jgi:PhoD-like phosphatase, N-terminal domain
VKLLGRQEAAAKFRYWPTKHLNFTAPMRRTFDHGYPDSAFKDRVHPPVNCPRYNPAMNYTRRLFLIRSVALAATVYAAPRFKKNPFSLGVMSGDPSPDGFVLWTRLAPDPLQAVAWMPRRWTWTGSSPKTRAYAAW